MGPSLFGRWVKDRLRDLSLSQRAFGKQVGISQSNLNKILNGSHEDPPTPLGLKCSQWADVLKIPDDQLKRFHLMAAVAHIPWPQSVEFEQLIDEHFRMKAQLAEMLPFYQRRVAEGSPPAAGIPPKPQP